MKCHCPACGRTVRVGPEMLDFPVRCDRCRTFLLPRFRLPAQDAADSPDHASLDAVQVLPLGGFAERSAATGQYIGELLTRRPILPPPPRPGNLAEVARQRLANDPPPASRDQPREKSRGAAFLWVLLAAALLLAGALALGTRHWAFAPALAQGYPPLSSTPQDPAPTSPSLPIPARQTAMEPVNSRAQPPVNSATNSAMAFESRPPQGSGELFPDVPARK